MSVEEPSVAVVVITRDRPDALRDCLASIADQSPQPDEVVIVAGSRGSCPDDLLSAFDHLPIRVVEHHDRNISGARNEGLEVCDADLVLFIDDDAVAHPGWVEAYRRVLTQDEGAWAAGGIAFDSRHSPPTPEFAFGLIAPSGLQVEVRDPNAVGLRRGYTNTVKGCNFGLRREPIVRIGAFDPFFAFAFDEADLMLSITRAGGRVVHLSGAVVDHAHAPGNYRQSDPLDRDWRTEYASHTMLMLKHSRGRERWWGWFVIARRYAKLACRVAYGVARGRVRLGRGRMILRDARGGIAHARSSFRRFTSARD